MIIPRFRPAAFHCFLRVCKYLLLLHLYVSLLPVFLLLFVDSGTLSAFCSLLPVPPVLRLVGFRWGAESVHVVYSTKRGRGMVDCFHKEGREPKEQWGVVSVWGVNSRWQAVVSSRAPPLFRSLFIFVRSSFLICFPYNCGRLCCGL
jgi:hypothetical protein